MSFIGTTSYDRETIRIGLDVESGEPAHGDDLADVADALSEKDDETLPEVIEQLLDVIGQRERRDGAGKQTARRKLTEAGKAYDEDRPRAAWNRVAEVFRSLR